MVSYIPPSYSPPLFKRLSRTTFASALVIVVPNKTVPLTLERLTVAFPIKVNVPILKVALTEFKDTVAKALTVQFLY